MEEIYASALSRQRLHQAMPLQIQAMIRHGEPVQRLIRAQYLYASRFPREYEAYHCTPIPQSRTQWLKVMFDFYKLVDSTFFKVDWKLIEWAQTTWIEAKGSPKSEKLLALFLKYIPFLPFGFTMIDAFTCPAIKILTNFLHVPFGSKGSIPVGALIGLSFLDQDTHSDLLAYADVPWGNPASRSARARVKAIKQNPEAWPEPIRYLPQFADWVMGRTPNRILGLSIDEENPWPWEVLEGESEWFTWDEHFTLISRNWRQAQPIIAAFRNFLAWCEEPEHLIWLIEFLLNGKGPETVPGIGIDYSSRAHVPIRALSLLNYTSDDLVTALPTATSSAIKSSSRIRANRNPSCPTV